MTWAVNQENKFSFSLSCYSWKYTCRSQREGTTEKGVLVAYFWDDHMLG